MLKVSGPGVKVVAGGRVSGVPIETVAYKANKPELHFVQVPGDGKVEFEFLLTGKGEVTVAYQSVKAGKVRKTVTLRRAGSPRSCCNLITSRIQKGTAWRTTR